MVFSDPTNLLGLIQSCESYTELGNAGISGNATLLKEFTRHINITNSKVWNWIFQSYGGWQYDDSNQTNLPSASQTLSTSAFKYALPTDALTVKAIEISDSNGNWTMLTPTTEELESKREALTEYGSDTAIPTRYILKGDTVLLDCKPQSTITTLKVYFDRGSVAFASNDTSKTPGFASEFHNVLAVGGAIEWLKVHKPQSAVLTMLMGDFKQYEIDIKKFYNKRYKDLFPPEIRVADYFRQMN